MTDFTTLLWIEYVILALISLAGVYIYFKKRKEIDVDDIWKFFLIMCFIKILDVFSTIYFTNKNGLHTEGNAVARYMMVSLGIYQGIALFLATSLPILFFFSVLIYYNIGGGKLWKIYKSILISIGVIVVIINFSA